MWQRDQGKKTRYCSSAGWLGYLQKQLTMLSGCVKCNIKKKWVKEDKSAEQKSKSCQWLFYFRISLYDRFY